MGEMVLLDRGNRTGYWHIHLIKLVLTLGCPWMENDSCDYHKWKCPWGLNVKAKLRGEGLLVVGDSRIVFLWTCSSKSHHQGDHLSLSIKGNIRCVTQHQKQMAQFFFDIKAYNFILLEIWTANFWNPICPSSWTMFRVRQWYGKMDTHLFSF